MLHETCEMFFFFLHRRMKSEIGGSMEHTMLLKQRHVILLSFERYCKLFCAYRNRTRLKNYYNPRY